VWQRGGVHDPSSNPVLLRRETNVSVTCGPGLLGGAKQQINDNGKPPILVDEEISIAAMDFNANVIVFLH